MPWRERRVEGERMRFVTKLEEGYGMSELCREFGISRKTGYKIWNRYQKDGPFGLFDEARRPYRSPNATAREVVEVILRMRHRHKHWGARKLKSLLENNYPELSVPAESTIGLILRRKGLVKKKNARRRATPSTYPLRESHKPNDIWAIDYKGQFKLGNGKYSYPLTVSDHHSRYLLACEGFGEIQTDQAMSVMHDLFEDHGLPEVIRSDNGAPFGSTGLCGLTKLSVWFQRLGIYHERIQPGHPEQNGRHERMHRTLKQEVTHPRGENLLQQQEKFDDFRQEYNDLRPHEALGMVPPKKIYKRSERTFNRHLEPLDYPNHEIIRTVSQEGLISFLPLKQKIYISTALEYQAVGIKQLEDQTWVVHFMDTELGLIDGQLGRLLRTNPKQPRNQTIKANIH